MKYEIDSVAVKEFVGLKPKISCFLVDNSEHKKEKGVNKTVILTISHNEYKDVLLDKKSLKQSINILKVKTIVQHNSTQINCLVLMTKYISKTNIHLMD